MLGALAALALLVGAGDAGDSRGDLGDVPSRATIVDLEGGVAPPTAAAALEAGERRWITHTVTPRERLASIAARYGVRRDDVVEWNNLRSRRAPLKTGTRLRIHTSRVPPPRRAITYVAQAGDSWSSIAVMHRVDYRDLVTYNWPRRAVTPGAEVTVWIDPGMPRTVNVKHGPQPGSLPEGLDGARSVGAPSRGRLKDAIQLPESPLYTRGHERWLWGSSHAVRSLIAGIAEFRYRSGYEGEVIVGSMSLRRGGRFRPHKSHQSGRDVDVRLPLLPGVPLTAFPNADEIDWSASWELVRAIIDTGEVEVIFLEGPLQRLLFQAALWEGMSAEELPRRRASRSSTRT
ncbi:MAG: penicillin-insensitive murein endopeptidase [Nannocystaceae bacterium]